MNLHIGSLLSENRRNKGQFQMLGMEPFLISNSLAIRLVPTPSSYQSLSNKKLLGRALLFLRIWWQLYPTDRGESQIPAIRHNTYNALEIRGAVHAKRNSRKRALCSYHLGYDRTKRSDVLFCSSCFHV